MNQIQKCLRQSYINYGCYIQLWIEEKKAYTVVEVYKNTIFVFTLVYGAKYQKSEYLVGPKTELNPKSASVAVSRSCKGRSSVIDLCNSCNQLT